MGLKKRKQPEPKFYWHKTVEVSKREYIEIQEDLVNIYKKDLEKEEARHQKWFLDQKNSLSLEIDEQNLKNMVPGVLEQMMGENTLSLDEIDFTKMENVADLLQTFIGFEQETIMFYEMLEMFIEEPSVLTGLESIVAEEKRHAEKLDEMRLSVIRAS